MKLEQQVTSLEISKRLKELGVKQESLFWWCFSRIVTEEYKNEAVKQEAEFPENFISAFTVAELGELLPNYVFSAKLGAKWRWSAKKWSNGDVLSGKDIGTFYADTEAEARGKMLIYLLENNLLKGGVEK